MSSMHTAQQTLTVGAEMRDGVSTAHASPSGADDEALMDPVELRLPEHPQASVQHLTRQQMPKIFERKPTAREYIQSAISLWWWQPIMLLLVKLHLDGVPHRAINMTISVISSIFILLGLIEQKSDVPQTLKTTIKRLHLDDEFPIGAMCPKCFRVYPGDSDPDTLCTACETPLFKGYGMDTNVVPGDVVDIWTDWHVRHAARRAPKPSLQVPMRLPSEMLADLINSTPRMEANLDKWRESPSDPGQLRCVQDGDVWKTIKGPDGTPFFDDVHAHELRIGVSMGFDGFGFTRSSFSGKHSTGALSLCVQNLDVHQRYRTENLLLCGLTPGPHELSSDDLQHFMAAFVTDLLMLYDTGIIVKTANYPEGRRVRLILIAVCCDHPAMCRLCGFGDSGSGNHFCTKCKVKKEDLNTPEGLTIDAFPARDPEEHRKLADEYDKLTTKEERDAFCREHGVRASELNRLPYWNPVRMAIVDPMHNVLLGLVRNIWFETWISDKTLRQRTQPKGVPRELDLIHEYLEKFEMPSWVARLPKEVGYPAGGNLTSDEWKALLLVYCPIVIPFIWEEWAEVADTEHQRKLATWEKNERARQRRNKARAEGDDPEPKQPKPTPRMQSQDADNFLSLAAAMKILLARTIDVKDLPRARELLQDYLDGFLKMHPDHVKPNHHYVTHTFDQIPDYGPVYGFWTYLFERLNKVLKGFSVNGHAGGELEVTFFRQFHRQAKLQSMLENLAQVSVDGDEAAIEDRAVREAARILMKTDNDTRGTVADLAQQTSDLANQFSVEFELGPGRRSNLNLGEQNGLLEYYTIKYPAAQVVARANTAPPPESSYLTDTALFHDYVTLHGRRIVPSRFDGRAGNSIVQINHGDERFVGEVQLILSHSQPLNGCTTRREQLIGVRWFKRARPEIADIWDPYPELEVLFWEHGVYLDPNREGPPFLLPVKAVLSQACRLAIRLPSQHETDEPPEEDAPERRGAMIWATCGLTRVRTLF
ncbi:hypothetical protein PsYK624_005560 [Phanerochaete sordida]|uniref:Transposase domain-containing protein n=1 Tax=Phanerochaete sordida TaxID=48140 RepID=A0A9P3FYD8_9APHY|nr:hypothetical protein PsYK624_005560 [Phanerochaete sordida]